ncbi:MAG: hypothetical protein E7029_12775 [Planctomycetaceae bacterium]|nr:hypothetical protein [Planctomycetaceae bacterium]
MRPIQCWKSLPIFNYPNFSIFFKGEGEKIRRFFTIFSFQCDPADLAQKLELSLPTVNAILNELTQDAILNELTQDAILNELTQDAILNELTQDAILNELTQDAILNELTQDAILNEVTGASRNRGYQMTEYIRLFQEPAY